MYKYEADKYNKEQFARDFAAEYRITIKQARRIIETVFEFLKKQLAKQEEKIYIVGFGTFYKSVRKPREYNLRGKKFTSTGRINIIFQPSFDVKTLQQELEQKDKETE